MSEAIEDPYPAASAILSYIFGTNESEEKQRNIAFSSIIGPSKGKHQLNRCESPAERLFLLGGTFCLSPASKIEFAQDKEIEEHYSTNRAWLVGKLVSLDKLKENFIVTQQAPICGYRVDFYFPELKLVVEIDGYKFHGEKGSFISDRQRDRALVAAGYNVARYSGSEIYKDPYAALSSLHELCMIESLRDFGK